MTQTETNDRKATMQQLRSEGLSKTDIAQRFGVSRQRVHELLGPDGQRPRPEPKPPKAPRQLAPCGTHAAAQRHVRHGTKPSDLDELCKVAWREYNTAAVARYRQRKKAADPNWSSWEPRAKQRERQRLRDQTPPDTAAPADDPTASPHR